MSYVRTQRGFGDAASTSQNVAIGGSLAGSAATAVIGSIAANGGTILGLTASSLVPVVGPIIAGITIGLQALIANSGCGPTCVVTSQWANQAAAQLDQLTQQYFALPSPRTDAQKAVALATFDSVWQKLQQLCGQPGTGNAGVRCITDRQAGACTWRQKYQPAIPGQPAIGACWNWFNGYRDVIANDPTVPDSVATQASGSIASVLSGGSGGSFPLLPVAAIAGLLVLGASL
jgi:hypothetical protein